MRRDMVRMLDHVAWFGEREVRPARSECVKERDGIRGKRQFSGARRWHATHDLRPEASQRLRSAGSRELSAFRVAERIEGSIVDEPS